MKKVEIATSKKSERVEKKKGKKQGNEKKR
jgi:hypothetical protein